MIAKRRRLSAAIGRRIAKRHPRKNTDMNAYCVRFFKTVSSHGKTVNVCQRSIDIRSAPSPGRAVEVAKERFACLENVPDWLLHADYVEVDGLSAITSDELNAGDIGRRHRRGVKTAVAEHL
jgi:hypothetical protein